MATFITSKAIGETITINPNSSTGFWKYNHDGSNSSVFDQNDGEQSLTVSNINGEFTIISCNSNGNVSGNLVSLYLWNNQIVSFNGTGLSSLIELNLYGNQLTSLDVSALTSLSDLRLVGGKSNNVGNPLTPSAHDQILIQLNQNGILGGNFKSIGSRTSESDSAYASLLGKDWILPTLSIVAATTTTTTEAPTTTTTTEAPTTTTTTSAPVVGSGKLRVKGVTMGI